VAWWFSVPVYLGEIASDEVAVQLYAEARDGASGFLGELRRGEAITSVATTRPAEDYTVRIIPDRPGARISTKLPLIWQK
jgi:hypothetical protein